LTIDTLEKPKRRVGRPPILEPDPIDLHVGARVRQRRTLLGLSQEKLGDRLNLTFQQVQKYERGANRIGASRLYELSRVLDVPVSYFFDDAPETGAGPMEGLAEALPSADFDPDPMAKLETLELVRAYYKIDDEPTRRKLFELAKSIAVSFGGADEDDES